MSQETPMPISGWLPLLALLLFPAGNAVSAQTITCRSEAGARNYCKIETHGNVRLEKQRSTATCILGTNWGFDEHGIWVDKGCSADFAVGAEGKVLAHRLSCSSDDGMRKHCNVDTRWSKVELAKQIGSAPCTEGSTWGHDDQGIWVDHGCRAEFTVEKISGYREKGCAESAGKQKAKEMVDECLQVSPATHPPCNAQNSCQLIEDEIRRSCKLIGVDAPAFCANYK
jgi:Protein of unknown function (DUF3011)